MPVGLIGFKATRAGFVDGPIEFAKNGADFIECV